MRSPGYEIKKERARRIAAALSVAGRDIGDIPAVADSARKSRCLKSFRAFCETYFKRRFYYAWSSDHLKIIARIEDAVLRGGLFAMAMPRGSGKTALCETACLWAMVCGHQPFTYLIGATDDHAAKMLGNVKTALQTNTMLAADFPEVCYPIHCLENQTRRCQGQLHHGKLTSIGWADEQIILPTIPGSRASGFMIRTAGITSAMRGALYTSPTGDALRPTMVIIDDPQTKESAKSPSQCDTREMIIGGDILGMAGPGRKIAGLMTLTVIEENDVAARMLDRARNPEWSGEKTKLVYAFPKNQDLWDKYAEIWAEGHRTEQGLKPATAFYKAHRAAMDEGAVVAWEDRHTPDEASAIQNAMNLKLRNERVFWAEYQNEPMAESQDEKGAIKPEEVLVPLRLSSFERQTVPLAATHVVGFVDVQAEVLFYTVLALADSFTGWVIDYGTEPDQKADYFNLRDLRRPLSREYKGAGAEGQIYGGLRSLMDRLAGHRYKREDGVELSLERCLVDAGWGESTNIVYSACRETQHHGLFVPSHGRGITASNTPMVHYKTKPGERLGLNWIMTSSAGRRSVRHATYDTNFWKSFAASRIRSAAGDSGSLRIFGGNATQGAPKVPIEQALSRHRLLADHWCSERAIRTSGRGREVDEWKKRSLNAENHFWDCLVGAYVAGSMVGCQLSGGGRASGPPKRRRMTVAERRSARTGAGA